MSGADRWLGLDGALGAFSCALVTGGEVARARVARTDGHDALERGLAAVDDALDGVPLASLDGIAVGTGPGSFTGLRIALSYAKGLAFATGVPLAGVSSYDALEPPEPPGTHATFVHGRAGIACVRLRDGDAAEFVACGTYDALADALAARLGPGRDLVAYGAAAGTAPALAERGVTVLAMPSDIDPVLAIVRRARAAGNAGAPHALVADYGEAHYAERTAATADPRR